ncbi:MAG: LLM class F420-dependent oxidoreductase [Acidimicrobiia bacterium]|nr:LLM class F420-dependent oxidoreductase [Acidimicrobiia bacterium]
MRFAIKTNPQNTTWPDLLAVWRRADEIETIESAWVFDHFYPISSDPTGPCLEGWTVLSALAHDTRRLRVGTMVNGMPYRHPAVTANMAAALDIISGGRFELGLGAGWSKEEADAYGISLGATVGERMDMFDEAVEAIVGLLTNEETTFDGVHVTLTNARNEPKGPQLPHPPIVIGGGGEKRTLRTVARWADHWNSTPLDPETWRHKRSVLDEHCAGLDRDPAEISSSMLFRFDPEDVNGLARQIAVYEGLGIDLAVFNLPTPHRVEHVEMVGDLAASMA